MEKFKDMAIRDPSESKGGGDDLTVLDEKRTPCQGQTCDTLGASNYPKASPKRSYEDSQSSSQSDGSDSDDWQRPGSAWLSEGSWNSIHRSASERRRRGKINKRLRALRELLPNSDEGDQVVVLDEIIEYLKTLKRDILIMSTGPAMFRLPPTMLPRPIQQIFMPDRFPAPAGNPGRFPAGNIPRGMNIPAAYPGQFPAGNVPRGGMNIPAEFLNQFLAANFPRGMNIPAGYGNQVPAVNLPRGMNIPAGDGCNGLPYPCPHGLAATTSFENTMRMLGLQFSPFVPSFGQPSMAPAPAPAPEPHANSGNLLDPAARSG